MYLLSSETYFSLCEWVWQFETNQATGFFLTSLEILTSTVHSILRADLGPDLKNKTQTFFGQFHCSIVEVFENCSAILCVSCSFEKKVWGNERIYFPNDWWLCPKYWYGLKAIKLIFVFVFSAGWIWRLIVFKLCNLLWTYCELY